MQERQNNREQYFKEQSVTTEKYVIPYINEIISVDSKIKVAEIGCGEGGNLKPFLEKGCKTTGIDLSESKIQNGTLFYDNHPLKENISLISSDIFNLKADENLKFDLIILRDTLEHIPNQELFLTHLKQFLKPQGKVFFAFPPWRMPFGGHQQMCRNKFLSVLPYYHILPKSIYKLILKLFGETKPVIEGLIEIKDTKISIQKFHKIVKRQNYKIDKLTYFLINPNYEVKFKLKPKSLPSMLNIPYLRDYFVTTIYAIISLKD